MATLEELKKQRYAFSTDYENLIEKSTSNTEITEILSYILSKTKSNLSVSIRLIEKIVNKGYNIPPITMEKLLNRVEMRYENSTDDKFYVHVLHRDKYGWLNTLFENNYQFTDKSMYRLFDTNNKYVNQYFLNKTDYTVNEINMILENYFNNVELLIQILKKSNVLPELNNNLMGQTMPNISYSGELSNIKLLLILISFGIEFNKGFVARLIDTCPVFKFDLFKNYIEKGFMNGKVQNLKDFIEIFDSPRLKKKKKATVPRYRYGDPQQNEMDDDIDNDTVVLKINNLCCENVKQKPVKDLIDDFDKLEKYVTRYYNKRSQQDDKMTLFYERNLMLLLDLAKKYQIPSYPELNKDITTQNPELVALILSFDTNNKSLDALEQVCLEGSLAKFKSLYENLKAVNENCLVNATIANSTDIVKEILQTKMEITNRAIEEIRSQEMVNVYLDFGMKVCYDTIKTLSKRNIYVPDLHKYDIAHDINIYVLYYKKASYKNKICYHNEFHNNAGMHMDIRDMINKTKKATDEIIIELIKKKGYVDLPMYNDALRFQRDKLAEFMEKELKIQKNVRSCLVISDFNCREEYYESIPDKSLEIDEKINLFK